MKNKDLSSAEAEVMQILWRGKKPMRVQEVCDALPPGRWEYKTVATLLLRMKEKGAVECFKENSSNRYSPVLDKESYTKAQTKSFIQRLYNGSVKDLAVSLLKSDELSAKDIDEIRKLFNL